MGVSESLGLAEADSVNETGMVERIADDSVAFVEKRFKQAGIGIKTGAVKNRVRRP